MGTDGIEVKGSAIQVALSNPPKKMEPEKKSNLETENVKSLGGTRGIRIKGKGKESINLHPTSSFYSSQRPGCGKACSNEVRQARSRRRNKERWRWTTRGKGI